MNGFVRRVVRTAATSVLLAGLAAVVLPGAASASVLDFGKCDNSSLSQPFTPWGDSDYYKLAPGGDFEGTLAGWSLRGGAQQIAGSESFDVTGNPDSSSLSLPAGAVATSPTTCVTAAYPDLRLFTRTDTPGSTVAVSVVYGGLTIPVGVVTPTSDWQPTVPMPTLSAIPGLLNGGVANVSLRFTAVLGHVQIDDAYIDPSGRCC
ncbi:MAG TPA: hypothetical protein VGI87_04910 [Solirubrobacteraceae bacterium]